MSYVCSVFLEGPKLQAVAMPWCMPQDSCLCSIWSVLRLKERLVKLFMEHSAHQHQAAVGSRAQARHPPPYCRLPMTCIHALHACLLPGFKAHASEKMLPPLRRLA